MLTCSPLRRQKQQISQPHSTLVVILVPKKCSNGWKAIPPIVIAIISAEKTQPVGTPPGVDPLTRELGTHMKTNLDCGGDNHGTRRERRMTLDCGEIKCSHHDHIIRQELTVYKYPPRLAPVSIQFEARENRSPQVSIHP